MNFNISKILHLAGTIFLISLSIISTLLAEVDDKNVNNPRGTTITNSSDGYAVDLDNGDSFTVINSGTINSSYTGDTIKAETTGGNNAYGIYNTTTTINDLTNTGTISAESSDDDAYGIVNDRATINGLTNSGTIKAVAADDIAYGIFNYIGGWHRTHYH